MRLGFQTMAASLRARGLATACGLALLACAAHSQPMPPPPAGAPASSVPVALQEVRWQMLNPGINALTFRSMDRIFDTREVTHRRATWAIPRNDAPLNFRYEFAGAARTPEDFLDRTYTNRFGQPLMRMTFLVQCSACVFVCAAGLRCMVRAFKGWAPCSTCRSL